MNKILTLAFVLALAGFSCKLEELTQIDPCAATPPKALFTPDKSSCTAPCTISFSNNSQNASEYFWDFGDSTSSSLSNPSHIFDQPGNYTIVLVASDDEGCSSTVSQVVNIEAPGGLVPIADFNADLSNNEGFAPCTVQFNNTSTNATSYVWDFGDGTYDSTQIHPIHYYSKPNDYVVKLISKNTYGADDQIKTFKIKSRTFKITYGLSGDFNQEEGNSVLQTADGGYIIVGTASTASASTGPDVLIVKFKKDGVIEWEKRIDKDEGYDQAFSIVQAPQGGYVISTQLAVQNVGFRGYLIIIDENGNEAGREYTSTESCLFITNTTDGGYISTGVGNYPVVNDAQAMMIKSNSAAKTSWYKDFGYPINGENETGTCIQQVADGGFIMSAHLLSGLEGTVIKTNQVGAELWRLSPQMYGILPNGLQETSDGGCILIGNATGPDADIYLIKVGSNGSEQWRKQFGGSGKDEGNFIQKTSDGGFIIVGRIGDLGTGQRDICLIKTNQNGELLWGPKIFSSGIDDQGKCVKETSDGGYIIVGTAGTNQASDVFLIKTDKNGNVQ